jgi:cytochrome c-type biogenesis protein CcmH
MAHGNFEGRPRAMLERALELAPGTPLALALAASAAFKRADMSAAAAYWERLLTQLPPTSDDARYVADRLAQARGAAQRSAASNQVATQP